jgi:hypothetical protein
MAHTTTDSDASKNVIGLPDRCATSQANHSNQPCTLPFFPFCDAARAIQYSVMLRCFAAFQNTGAPQVFRIGTKVLI